MQLSERELTIPLPWGNLKGLAWGDERGLLLVCLHGYSDNAASFRALGQELVAASPSGYYVVALDLPGHGKSDHYPAGLPLTVPALLCDLRRALLGLSLGAKFHLVAHSYGALMGLYLGALYPDSVSGLILLDPSTPDLCEPSLTGYRLHRLIEATLDRDRDSGRGSRRLYTEDEALSKFSRSRFVEPGEKASRALLERSTRREPGGLRFTSDRRNVLLVSPLVTGEAHLGVLSGLEAPLLVLKSDSSVALPSLELTLNFLRSTLGPRFTQVTVEGDHFLHMDYPGRVTPFILEHLKWLQNKL